MPVLTTTEEKRTSDIILPPRWPGDFDGGGDGGPESSGSGFPLSKTQIAMWLLLTAVVMLFAGLSSAYVVLRGLPTWQNILVPRLAWLNTIVLILSSFSLEAARSAVTKRQVRPIKRWVGISGVLGLGFLFGQIAVWSELVAAGVYLQSTLHSSFFYVLSAIHGLHVIGGLIGMALVYFKTSEERFKACALYWHFMGAIWLYLFILIMLA